MLRASRLLLAPLAVAASAVALSVVPTPPAGAGQLPVVVSDPFECPNPNGMDAKIIWGCQFALAPKKWGIVPSWQWQSSVPLGRLVMHVKHWAYWGGFMATGSGTVTFGLPDHSVSCAAQIQFTFPVTFQGHLVYASYSIYPDNCAGLGQHADTTVNGVAL